MFEVVLVVEPRTLANVLFYNKFVMVRHFRPLGRDELIRELKDCFFYESKVVQLEVLVTGQLVLDILLTILFCKFSSLDLCGGQLFGVIVGGRGLSLIGLFDTSCISGRLV